MKYIKAYEQFVIPNLEVEQGEQIAVINDRNSTADELESLKKTLPEEDEKTDKEDKE